MEPTEIQKSWERMEDIGYTLRVHRGQTYMQLALYSRKTGTTEDTLIETWNVNRQPSIEQWANYKQRAVTAAKAHLALQIAAAHERV